MAGIKGHISRKKQKNKTYTHKKDHDIYATVKLPVEKAGNRINQLIKITTACSLFKSMIENIETENGEIINTSLEKELAIP